MTRSSLRVDFPHAAANIDQEPSWTQSAFTDEVWVARCQDGLVRSCDFNQIPLEFRLTCKYLLWAIEYEVDSDVSRIQVTAALAYIGYFYEYRKFASFLFDRGVKRLTSVSRQLCVDYIKWRAAASGGLGMSYGRITSISAMLDKLFALGPAGIGKIPDGLIVSIPFREVVRIVGVIEPGQETPILPDHIARTLFNAAYDFLRHAEDLCLLIETERLFAESKQLMLSRQYSGFLHRARERFIIDHGLEERIRSALSGLAGVAHLSDPEKMRFGRDYRGKAFSEELSLMMWTRLMLLLQHLLAACFIIIAMSTGFRSGEILSLERGWMQKAQSRLRLRTRVTKHTGQREGVEVDRTVHPIVLRVYEVLELVAIAKGNDGARLWSSPKAGFVNGLKLSPMLREFTQRVARIDGWHITSRQFRRHYAVFFVRRFQGPEDALSYVFLHKNPRELEAYVKDRSNAKHLLEAQKELAAEIYMDRFEGGDAYRSRFKLDAVEHLLRYAALNGSIDLIDKELAKLIADGFYEIRPTFWGYCVLRRRSQAGAKCAGRDGMPDVAEMHPGNCCGCKFLVTGREHVPFWRGALKEHQAAVRHPSRPALAREASQRFIEAALAIIASHGESV